MGTKRKEIYLVPYAHLDTQWRWEFPTTIQKYLKKTLIVNFKFFERFPEYSFNFTGALRYSMMKEYYPEDFHRLKDYVQQGRWHVAGTSLDETDAVTPSPESMIRNILYGHQWFKQELGKSSNDYMLPDCFGFPASMPTILSHCNISGFSTQKLAWGSAVGIPFEVGMWQGPDGSEVACALNPCAYLSFVLLPPHINPARLKRLWRLGQSVNVWKSFQYYGVGDIGGAPTQKSIKRVFKSIKRKNKNISVRQGAADLFFQELTQDEKGRMERFTGDMLLTQHSAGVLTSAAIMKRWNRMNEQRAFAGEAAAVAAHVSTGASYPVQKILSAWNRVIISQMHDILPGTCTPNAYNYSNNDEVVALNTWSAVLQDASKAVANHIKSSDHDGHELLLFNPCDVERRDMVQVTLPENTVPERVCVINPDGQQSPCHVTTTQDEKQTVLFSATMPSLGWGRFTLCRNKRPDKDRAGVSITREKNHYLMENNAYSIKIANDGCIYSIKHMEREVLKHPLAYEFQKERPLNFPAWNMDWRDRRKPPFKRIEKGGEVTIVEDGPLRCTIRVVHHYNRSKLMKEISLGENDDTVSFTERISWRETGCSLKLAMSFNLHEPRATFNWETCRIERHVNNSKLYEMPSHLWVDMSEKDGSWGVGLLENCKYGYDRPNHGTLRLTLLYTPAIWYLTGFWDQRSQDWGEHTIRYALFAHEGDWRQVDEPAHRFNQPIQAFSIKKQPGVTTTKNAPAWFSLCKPSTPQIRIMALKAAEDGDGIVVRINERHGNDLSEGALTFPYDILDACELNGLEQHMGPATFTGKSLKVSLNANGIRTYLVRLAQENPKLTTPQTQIKLPYNTRMFTTNGQTSSQPITFPAELVPETIESGPIQFELSKNSQQDTLTCNAQKIVLPEGFNSLYLLAAANVDCSGPIQWLDKDDGVCHKTELHFPAMTGFIGQWDTRTWKKKPKHEQLSKRDYIWNNKCTGVTPGYIKRQRLEWYSTHTHQNGKDQSYQFGYMFRYGLSIPEKATQIMLPDDSRIKVFAITAANPAFTAQDVRTLGDPYDY